MALLSLIAITSSLIPQTQTQSTDITYPKHKQQLHRLCSSARLYLLLCPPYLTACPGGLNLGFFHHISNREEVELSHGALVDLGDQSISGNRHHSLLYLKLGHIPSSITSCHPPRTWLHPGAVPTLRIPWRSATEPGIHSAIPFCCQI